MANNLTDYVFNIFDFEYAQLLFLLQIEGKQRAIDGKSHRRSFDTRQYHFIDFFQIVLLVLHKSQDEAFLVFSIVLIIIKL